MTWPHTRPAGYVERNDEVLAITEDLPDPPAAQPARTVLDEVEPQDAENAYRKALESGLLKVMAKMGISCVASYCGGMVFEALGLGAEVMEVCLPDVPSRVGGADFGDLEGVIREHHAAAWTANETPPDLGLVRFRKAGEWHAHNPLAVPPDPPYAAPLPFAVPWIFSQFNSPSRAWAYLPSSAS